MLSTANLKKAGLFDAEKVSRLVAKYRNAGPQLNSEVQNMAIMGILSAQLVYHHFIENSCLQPASAPVEIVWRRELHNREIHEKN